MSAGAASVVRNGEALVFAGVLDRAAAAALWPQARALVAGSRRFDLSAVSSVDSAGLALLAELAAQAHGAGSAGAAVVGTAVVGTAVADTAVAGVEVLGEPAGLAELRAAYRLDASLGFGH